MEPRRCGHLVALLPEDLRTFALEPWVPWPWIEHRHRDLPASQLTALFGAYGAISGMLDVGLIVDRLLPAEEDDGCRRCGSCCAELIPDPVTNADIDRWAGAGNPLALMYQRERGENPDGRLKGWVFGGVPLRLCPFLLRDPDQGSSFCALHGLGPGQRPEACSAFTPSYPHCAVCYRPGVL
ncbi:MAG: hypothetical protein JSV00_05650 [bacterium]|nr:MAG: hypothetical protein JSV00_05650 [bacterium]